MMKKNIGKRWFMVGVGLLFSSASFAYDCSSDCSGGEFSYICPTFSDPGRTCHGHLPNDAACLIAKEASCQMWEGAVGFASEKMKPFLDAEFNQHTYAAAQVNGEAASYDQSCVGAGVAVCGALGAELGGPWGAVVSGALGAFVSFRVCEQSKSW